MTLPQQDLQALASNVSDIFPAPPEAGLICDADKIFNRSEVAEALAEILKQEGKETDLRKELVGLLMARRKAAMAQIATAFRASPRRRDLDRVLHDFFGGQLAIIREPVRRRGGERGRCLILIAERLMGPTFPV